MVTYLYRGNNLSPKWWDARLAEGLLTRLKMLNGYREFNTTMTQLKACELESLDLSPEEDTNLPERLKSGKIEYSVLDLHEEEIRGQAKIVSFRDIRGRNRICELFYPFRELLALSSSKLRILNLE